MKKFCFILVLALMVSSVTVFADSAENVTANATAKNQIVQTANSNYKEAIAAEKEALKQLRYERKQQILAQYTAEELAAVTEAGESIEAEDPMATALDVDSILSDGMNFKFDTPPVIKGNRTLIPVRAITKGLGAELYWDQQDQITITKGSITIILTLGSNIAYVNGEEVVLDSKASITNNRTYVPMRFIMETFKMKVT